MDYKLERLEKIDLRQVWENEAGNFTPWLAEEENLKLLGDTIGLDLELVGTETAVGSFSADIVCINTQDDSKVLIENQLEKTDHTHLGQIITYAAGLDAITVIWLAKRITDEHRAGLDWLNEITEEGINFFGLEIELWKIGDSNLAPKFNIVSKPNEWTGSVSRRIAKPQLTDDKLLQLQFWTDFKTYVSNQDSDLITPTPKAGRRMSITIGRSGIHLAGIASFWDSESYSYKRNEIRAEVHLSGSKATERFLALEQLKSDIEEELGEPMTWYNPDDSKMSRIYIRKTVDLRNTEHRQAQYAWLLEKLEKLHTVFALRVRDL